MRKIIRTLLITSALVLGITSAYSAVGDVVGTIYSTDILASVNGKPIDAYNIGGRTVVIAEDLNKYGYNCWYDEDTRKLEITSYFTESNYDIAEIPRGKVGKVAGYIYETDIEVTYNKIPVKGYNLGGRTAICLEDLGDLADSPNADYGYSKYLAACTWDAENRTISLNSYISNDDEIMGLNISRISYGFKDNVLTVIPDDNEVYTGFSQMEYTDEFEDRKYRISPLYLDIDGNLTEVGTAVTMRPYETDILKMHIHDSKAFLELAETAKNPQLGHDEAIEMLIGRYTLQDRIENDDFTVLRLADDEGMRYVYTVKKSGGCLRNGVYSPGYTECSIELGADNVLYVNIAPYAGPHGATTCREHHNLSDLSFR